MSGADTVVDRLDRLARISAYPWKLTRRVFTPSTRKPTPSSSAGWRRPACRSGAIPPAT
ncbi:hypothetical protein ACFQFG_19240 [Methylobacterium persicinum]